MKYAVSEINGGIAVLENIEDGTIKKVKINLLPNNIKEGSIVVEGKYYVQDISEEDKRRKKIQDKLNKLKKN